uniref:Uncharacterized protein n=1 Tax=Anguilla anguilla TaxID=7936 RepID=A0A0E9U4T7_ANGAN
MHQIRKCQSTLIPASLEEFLRILGFLHSIKRLI